MIPLSTASYVIAVNATEGLMARHQGAARFIADKVFGKIRHRNKANVYADDVNKPPPYATTPLALDDDAQEELHECQTGDTVLLRKSMMGRIDW